MTNEARELRRLDRHLETCAGCDRRPGCMDWQDPRRGEHARRLHAAELEAGWQPTRPWLRAEAERAK